MVSSQVMQRYVAWICMMLCIVHMTHSFQPRPKTLHHHSQLRKDNQPIMLAAPDMSSWPSVAASAAAVAGVIAFHEAGHFLAARVQGIQVSSFNIGYGPKLISVNDSSNIEYSLRAFPFGGYVAFPPNVERDEEGEVVKELDDPSLLQNRPALQRMFVISAGVMANILLTIGLSSYTAMAQGISTPIYDAGIRVVSIQQDNVGGIVGGDTAGFLAGLRAEDVILEVNKVPILGSDSAVRDFVSTVRNSEGRALELTIRKPTGNLVSAVVVPQANSRGKVSLGLGINAIVKDVITQRATNVIDALRLGCQTTQRLFVLTWNAITSAISTGFKGAELGGPISVISTGSAMASSSPTALLGFAATLSINLAVLNSLPYPALDGGQFVTALLELVTRRKIPRPVQEWVTGIAFLALALFSLSTVVGDVDRLVDPPIIQSPMRGAAMFPSNSDSSSSSP